MRAGRDDHPPVPVSIAQVSWSIKRAEGTIQNVLRDA